MRQCCAVPGSEALFPAPALLSTAPKTAQSAEVRAVLERSPLPLNGLPDGRVKQGQASPFAGEGGNGVTTVGTSAVQSRV
jgi:hypothetical protein